MRGGERGGRDEERQWHRTYFRMFVLWLVFVFAGGVGFAGGVVAAGIDSTRAGEPNGPLLGRRGV